jgi:hypothetical protein
MANASAQTIRSMKSLAMFFGALASTPSMAKDRTFNCKLDPPQDVRDFEPETRISTINLFNTGSGKWEFDLSLDQRTITIRWPASPMQLEGRGPLIQTGPTSFATFLASPGPCLFTDGNCGSAVIVSEQIDKSLKLLVQPLAIINLKERGYQPYKIFINGVCKPTVPRN